MKRKFIILTIIAVLLSGIISMPVSAKKFTAYQNNSPYYSYEYNAYDELTFAPDGYIPADVIYLDNTGIDMTDTAISDVFFDGKLIYALDSGLSRVIVLNRDFTLNKVIDKDSISQGKYTDIDLDFTGAAGISVENDGQILICDTDHERILIIKDGVLTGLITRPDTTAISKELKFDVKKVVRTGANYYVVVESVVTGVMVFNENFEFLRLFGSNNVVVTSEVLLQQLQNIYMSDEQIAARRKFSASKINGIDIDGKGFVVVISSDPELTLSGSAVRCLNFKGDEVALANEENVFGDKFTTKANTNAFTDISVDSQSFYVLLDSKYGRVFVYSEKGLLVSCFGGIGNQAGLFKKPTAVTTFGEEIIVLDSEYNSFTVFKPTEYGKIKRDLICIIDSGNTKKVAELTDSLLKYNTNCQYAHYARGFVAEQSGDYKTAMKYYELANDRESYGQAFKLYRTQYLRDNIIWIFLIVVVVIAVLAFGITRLANGLKKKEGALYCPLESNKKGFPVFALFHPADAFWQIKTRDVLSPAWLIIVTVLFVYSGISSFLTDGFLYNANRAQDFNILLQFAKTIGFLVVFIISNWAICTIMDGKGSLKEIVYTVMYALIPYVFTQLIRMGLTHVLTSEESVLISVITSIGIIWSAIIIFVGLLTIHEYSVGKAVFVIVLTFIGMMIILLLLVLFYILIGQTVSFVQSIFQEYTLQH